MKRTEAPAPPGNSYSPACVSTAPVADSTVGIASTANRGVHARILEPLRVANGQILPEFNRSSQQHRGLRSYHLVLVHSSAYALGAVQSDADASEGQVRFVARSFIVSPRRPDFNDPDLWSITPG